MLEASTNMPWFKRLKFKEVNAQEKTHVYKIGGIGTVPVGRVGTCILKPGCVVVSIPANITTEEKFIEMQNEALTVASDSKNNPRKNDADFNAQVIVLNHSRQIANGYTPMLNCHTAHITSNFDEINEKVDRGSSKITEENQKFIN